MRDLGSPTIPYLPDDNADRGILIDGDGPDLAIDVEESTRFSMVASLTTVWLAEDMRNQQNCAIKIMVSGPYGEHDYQMQTTIHETVTDTSHLVLYKDVFLLRGPQYSHYTFVFRFLGPNVESLVAKYFRELTRGWLCPQSSLPENLSIADKYKILGRPERMMIDSWKQAELVKPMQIPIILCSTMIYLAGFGITTQVGIPKDGLHLWILLSRAASCVVAYMGPLPKDLKGKYLWPGSSKDEWYDPNTPVAEDLDDRIKHQRPQIDTVERKLLVSVLTRGFSLIPENRLTASQLRDPDFNTPYQLSTAAKNFR
ncbi:serine/threonine protein kinase [Nannizzia gypsea CBS 118893]|uniref:Serine/threonine protein kinase n=1 Tax=Arthroderma gypseum (strain ATCC MYA-4604 / CBS 118893) TaxID=535722 RepID=E4UYV4_ARTGP|nr:serine/threonine protein kinase [Nannizzia gypsea CBS 118893]EFR03284.1 serine/threonine protein kinase [Nannizzia gypsea CBS 118893]